jgi:3-hydroxyisobutyrate dehydrogenase-like beta-hydroxyacid dehydrogenase
VSSGTVGWIGLGLIGLPMAARLAAAGWTVRGFDLSAERLALAASRGIAPVSSHEAAAAESRIVFTSLPTEQAVEEVAGSLAGAMRADAIVIETSTIGPRASARAAARLRGRAYLRAPISGSTALAETGALTTFVSGPRHAFEAAREALAAYTRAQVWLGEAEEARYAKLAVNLMVAVTAGMMGEALALARKGGIGWERLLDLVAESVVASPLVKYKLEPLRRRDFSPAATNALLVKDLELIVEAARQAGVPVPLASHMQALYGRILDSELANEDFFSVVKLVERDAGLGEPQSSPVARR